LEPKPSEEKRRKLRRIGTIEEGNRPRPPGSGDIGDRSRKISDITLRYLLRRAPCGALLGFRGASRAAPPRSARPANRRKASDSL